MVMESGKRTEYVTPAVSRYGFRERHTEKLERRTTMAEYIDREKAKRLLHIEYAYAAEQLLDEIPAADVAPVVRGWWEKEPSSYWRWTSSRAVAVTRTTYRCGLCGRGTAVKSNYCPNCGAKTEQEAK
jgi:rubrerythrin